MAGQRTWSLEHHIYQMCAKRDIEAIMTSNILGVSPLARIHARALGVAAIALCVGGTPRAVAAGASADADASAAASASSARHDWVGTWATALTTASPFDTNRSQTGFENES